MTQRLLLTVLLSVSTLAGLGCPPPQDVEGPGPLATASASAAAPELPPLSPFNVGLADTFDCEKNADGSIKDPVAPGTYQGILKNAKCDQQKFITMGRLAQTLGVACSHCHVPDPNDPKKEDYPVMTERKHIANWMSNTLVRSLRQTDGAALQCSSCHKDEAGKPVAKVLKDPRDLQYAQEWMHEVMTSKLMQENGEGLKCKTCHVGVGPGAEGWRNDVIRKLQYNGHGLEREQG